MTRNPSLPRRHIIHVPVGTAYIEAVLIPRLIAEALEPIPGPKRMNIQAAHFWAMQSEMQAGTLPVCNENRRPGGRMEAGYFVRLADARTYLAGIEFELREDGAEDATPAMLDLHQFEAAQAVAELFPAAMREKERQTRPASPGADQASCVKNLLSVEQATTPRAAAMPLKGVTRQVIMEKFRLAAEWGERLQKAPSGKRYKYLKGVWMSKGVVGGDPSLYSPARVAKALIGRDKGGGQAGKFNRIAMVAVINHQFPEWEEEWFSITDASSE